MRVKHIIMLALVGFLMISPIISMALRAAVDTAQTRVDTVEDTAAITPEPERRRPLVYVMTIDGAIGAVTADRIDEAIERADNADAELLVIRLDTPGGFTRPTWTICKSIMNSPIPVAVYIAPSGARAGSAGVYITYASHFAAMAPSTNIGAAHPVSGSGEDIDSVMNEKITNDAAAQIRAAAEERGRNAEWGERAVRESVSITDVEALDSNVVDIRAANIEELLDKIHGREIEMPHGTQVMYLKNARTKEVKTSWVYQFLEVITQPDIAFILMSIGGLGIMLELYNPGSILPGVVGAICLILAFYSFQTLPINYAGVALIILSVILFIAEVKIVSHGLLTIGGLVSLFLGGLMLVDTVDPDLKVSMSVLITVVACVGLAVGIAGWLVVKAARSQPATGYEGLIGKTAKVRKPDFVYVSGALWKAESRDGTPLEVGEKVEIVGVDDLTLKVRKLANS